MQQFRSDRGPKKQQLLCARPNCQKTNQTQKAVSKYVIKIWLVQFAIYMNSISYSAERIPSYLCISFRRFWVLKKQLHIGSGQIFGGEFFREIETKK